MQSLCLLLLSCMVQYSYSYVIACYYQSYATTRILKGRLYAKNIDPFVCTHIIYAFAKVDWDTGLIANGDQKKVKHERNYKQLMTLKVKNPNLKILISVGGSAHEKLRSPFSKMVNTEGGIERFTASAVKFLKAKGFDGLDVDWEYPGYRPKNDKKKEDKQKYTQLIQSLSKALKKEGLLLTLALPNNPKKIDTGFELQKIYPLVDFINVMAYGMTASNRTKTGHHTPIGMYKYNVDLAVTNYTGRGIPGNKLNLGIGMYARTYRLASAKQHGLQAPTNMAKDQVVRGPILRRKSYFTRYEICYKKWTATVTKNPAMCPYSYNLDDLVWASYDDKCSINKKINDYVEGYGLKGIAVWSVDLDDYTGKYCHEGPYPIMNVIKTKLKSLPQNGGKGNFNFDCDMSNDDGDDVQDYYGDALENDGDNFNHYGDFDYEDEDVFDESEEA